MNINKKSVYHKPLPAFTLLEVMISISVIAILAGIVTFAATSLQKSSRDDARDAQSRVITNALEKYYREKGEYPSVALMASSNVGTLMQKLAISDSTIFKLPGSSLANSITASSPSPTTFVYSASTTDASKNSQCQSDINGYCDAFELRYAKESDGQTVTSTSLNNSFVAVAEEEGPSLPVNHSDDFTGSGSLGNVKTGSPQLPWQFLNSSTSNWSRNSGGYATTTVGASSNPILAANFGASDVSITEGVRSTGNAIYFRVVDGDDWMRARVNMQSSYSTSSWYTDYFEYQVRYESHWYSSGNPPVANTPSEAVQNCYSWTQTNTANGNYTATRGCGDAVYNTSTSTTNSYYLVLDKSVNGVVTQLASRSLGSSLPAYIKVVANGSSIQSFYGSTNAAVSSGSSLTDTTNQNAKLHGVGYASSSSGSPSGINSISIIDAQ